MRIEIVLDVAKEARRLSRDAVRVPGKRVIPDKRRKPPKHKRREGERENS